MIPQISAYNNLIPGGVAANTGGLGAPGSPPVLPVVGNTGSAANNFEPPVLASQGIGGAIQAVLQIVGMVLSGTGKPGGTSNAGGAGGSGKPAFDLGGGKSAAARDTDIPNTTQGDAEQSARLDDVLAGISQDPEGSKLLQAAKEKGYTIEVGDPSQAAGALDAEGGSHPVSCDHCKAALDAGQQVNGITISGDEKKIIINPNAPDFEKTVVHELVHAATDDDDNSQQEEGIADVIGYRVAARLTGEEPPEDVQSIYQNKMANYLDLNGTNSVRDTLAELGIDAGI